MLARSTTVKRWRRTALLGTKKYGLYLQSVSDSSEIELSKRISERLDLASQVLDRWAKVAAIEPKQKSEIAADDESTAWRHLSHTVVAGLNLAADNLRAVTSLIRPDGQRVEFPSFAHYPMLRAALEGGSLALWLVGPDDPRIRFQRLIRVAWAEMLDESVLTRAAIQGYAAEAPGKADAAMIDRERKRLKARRAKHAQHLRGIARRFGLKDPTEAKWPVGYAEIVRDATDHIGIQPYFGKVVWRMISGLSHPSVMRSASRSNLEEIARNQDGTLNAILTTDLGLTRMTIEAAVLSTCHAVEKFAERKIRPADRANYPSTI